LSYQEIARILEISVDEVKKTERRALMKLKKPSPANKRMHQLWTEYKEDLDTDEHAKVVEERL
jgi:DNA-directed RNA polymerase sigma subunit (sigma70/sigma32)